MDKGQKRVTFDDVLRLVGDSGRWQYVVFFFLWMENIFSGFHALAYSFFGLTPDHWCSLDHLDFPKSWNLTQKKQFAIPLKALNESKFDQCHMFNLSNVVISEDSLGGDWETIPCQGYTYESTFGNTIVSEWDLVCDRLPLLSTVQSIYMAGVFLGCIFWGWCSDKFGRRPSILVASALEIVTTIITSFSVNYTMFVTLRFFVGFTVSGVFECGFVLVTEIVGPKLRTNFGILTQLPFGLGASLLPLIAYFVKDWDWLQLAISLPCLLLISYYWFIPESPRWLVSSGRIEEALDVLKKAAKQNKKTLPSDDEVRSMLEIIHEDAKTEEVQKTSETCLDKTKEVFNIFLCLLRTPEMRKRTLNMFYSWMVVAMVYYGLSFNTKNISKDIYIPLFISGFVEILATIVILPALAYFGRVKVYCGTFLSGGGFCLAVAILQFATTSPMTGPIEILLIALSMTGKFLICGAFALAYLYTAELFPTPVRNVAVGAASTFARVGALSAPYIVDLIGKHHPAIPALIFGVFSTTAGIGSLLLPETLNKRLPATVAEVEASAKNKQTNSNVEMGKNGHK